MSRRLQLRGIWCALTGAILAFSALSGTSWLYAFVPDYDSNRWIHFLAYAVVAAIPVAAWRRRFTVLFSLLIVLLGVSLESLRMFVPQPVAISLNILPDFFGISAGILLGLNLRMMRNSARSLEDPSPNNSRSAIL